MIGRISLIGGIKIVNTGIWWCERTGGVGMGIRPHMTIVSGAQNVIVIGVGAIARCPGCVREIGRIAIGLTR